MDKKYKDYTFSEYYEEVLSGVEYWEKDDGYMRDGYYLDEDELVSDEWENFTEWVDKMED